MQRIEMAGPLSQFTHFQLSLADVSTSFSSRESFLALQMSRTMILHEDTSNLM